MKKIKKKLYELRTAPYRSYNSDLYLVEFPKSGITWFSTILANLYYLRDLNGKRPTYFNLEQIIGDVHQNKYIQIPQVYPYHRTIKSHAYHNSRYRNVVYLLRNPFSVMESYYNFAIANHAYGDSFDSFVKDPVFGIDAWCNHVNSWVYAKSQQNFQIIRYEQLHTDPVNSLFELFESIGFFFSEEEITEAVDHSSFDKMRLDNDRYNKLNPNRSYSFVRSGKVRSEMNDEVRSYISERSVELLENLYPEFL